MVPSVSVITPSYNQGEFIERTIRSVLDQNIEDLEYLIVDGGSTDGTLDILKAYEHRIRWISERDRGQAHAINKGIRGTRGEIICWLNSDDIYYPGSLSAIQRFFHENPWCNVVYGDADHIDVHDDIIDAYYTEDWNYERLREVCFICQPALFFRRRVTDLAGLLDESLKYCMDYEYWLRLGAYGRFRKLNQTLAGSRLYPANKTLGSRVNVHREINDMLCKRLGYVPNRWVYNFAHAVVEQRGYQRDDPVKNIRYVLAVVGESISASFRWRGGLTLNAAKDMSIWLLASLKNLMEHLSSENRLRRQPNR